MQVTQHPSFQESGFADLRLAGDELVHLAEASQQVTHDSLVRLEKEIQDYTRTSVDQGLEALRSMMAVRTLPEAVELQYKYNLEAFKDFTEHLQSLHQIGIELSQKAMEPLADCFDGRFTKFTGMRSASA
ncbi:phasin family protein [Govanella unica]|uniref:Phasin family protein n=1 Tax=Govanella unica TaxID=2975056 RepID=A0A9X3U0H1_9PROT|nr:phasin family protein [Govania unica]MDA5194797.1 phasin family protein [Govania unica]